MGNVTELDRHGRPSGAETEREKEIGQHIGYRYDVNLVPDYAKMTPFLRRYIEFMGWEDLNWLEDVHMGYEEGKPAVFRSQHQWLGSGARRHGFAGKSARTGHGCARASGQVSISRNSSTG